MKYIDLHKEIINQNINDNTFIDSNIGLNKWSKYDYMDNLSIKASGNKDDWKNKDSKIKIYKSTVFKYNCINESIEIE